MRLVFIIILWFLLGLFYFLFAKAYCCQVEENFSSTTSAIIDQNQSENFPLAFNWSASKARFGDNWNVYKDSIVNSMRPNKILEITGLYCSEESNENLGLERAEQAQTALGLPNERVELKSRAVDCNLVNRTKQFVATRFISLIKTDKVKEEMIQDSLGNIAMRTTIYFPFNSTQKLNDEEVEVYLDEIANRVIETGEHVRLVGHTDNIGDPKNNLELGRKRAKVVERYLIERVVDPSKIVTKSDGESTPRASNATEEGQAKNRRTELTIIK